LLAAAGRSTRSIAAEVGVQPRIVSNWRRRFGDHGLDGLRDRPRAGKKPIYGKATNKRILALLDKPPPQGYARWTGPLLAKALGDVDVQYVWRFLREHNIDLAARKSWCESNDPEFVAKAADVVGLYVDPPTKALNTHKKNERWLKKHPTSVSISPRPGRRGSIRSKLGFRSCRASH
jgi:transposase